MKESRDPKTQKRQEGQKKRERQKAESRKSEKVVSEKGVSTTLLGGTGAKEGSLVCNCRQHRVGHRYLSQTRKKRRKEKERCAH